MKRSVNFSRSARGDRRRSAAEIVALFPRANATARRRIRECAEYVRVETALRDKS